MIGQIIALDRPELVRKLVIAGSGPWSRLDELRTPVLIANGAHDVMEHAYQTYAMSQRIPDSKAVLCGDAGQCLPLPAHRRLHPRGPRLPRKPRL